MKPTTTQLKEILKAIIRAFDNNQLDDELITKAETMALGYDREP